MQAFPDLLLSDNDETCLSDMFSGAQVTVETITADSLQEELLVSVSHPVVPSGDMSCMPSARTQAFLAQILSRSLGEKLGSPRFFSKAVR